MRQMGSFSHVVRPDGGAARRAATAQRTIDVGTNQPIDLLLWSRVQKSHNYVDGDVMRALCRRGRRTRSLMTQPRLEGRKRAVGWKDAAMTECFFMMYKSNCLMCQSDHHEHMRQLFLTLTPSAC